MFSYTVRAVYVFVIRGGGDPLRFITIGIHLADANSNLYPSFNSQKCPTPASCPTAVFQGSSVQKGEGFAKRLGRRGKTLARQEMIKLGSPEEDLPAAHHFPLMN